MISVNGVIVEQKHFPDGTQRLLDFQEQRGIKVTTIVWQYENDEELVTLYFIVNHIKNNWINRDVNLYMPYVPNARMDRTKSSNEMFTLKHFCKLINDMDFTQVRVFDPHSYVSEALINRIVIERPDYIIGRVFAKIALKSRTTAVYFPDDGAMNKILDLEIYNANGDLATEDDIKGQHILMVDDIMSYGGTLAYSADKLKELGAAEINAYVSHCEKSVLDRENGTFIKRLENETVKKLYTTNSIFLNFNAHPQIDVIKLPNTQLIVNV